MHESIEDVSLTIQTKPLGDSTHLHVWLSSMFSMKFNFFCKIVNVFSHERFPLYGTLYLTTVADASTVHMGVPPLDDNSFLDPLTESDVLTLKIYKK